MSIVKFGLFMAFGLLSISRLGFSEPLFSLSGKSFEAKDFTPAQQQQLYELQFENYEKTKMAIDGLVLEAYVDEEVKKQGKSRDEVMNKLMEVKPATDKDIKKWYEDNKAKIPPNYKFDDIKDKIGEIVKQERSKAKRDELLEKIKKDRQFVILVSKPVAPVVDVKVDGFPTKGKEGAKVVVVEFADYQCPHCKTASESMKKVMDKFKDKVKLVYADFSINPSGISKIVAEGSHCATEQGKYWEYHYKAFEGQATLDKDSPTKLAQELKLDAAKFKACVDSGKGKALADKGRAEGERIGVSGTPHLLINGRRYIGAHTVEALTAEIQAALK